MRRITSLLVMALALVLCSTVANASMVDISYETGYSIQAYTRQYGPNWNKGTYYTAEFDVTIDGQSGYTGYCVDIFHYAGDGNFDVIGSDEFGIAYQRAAYLMDNYAMGLNDDDPVSGYSRKATITALSSAIWEVTQYDSWGWDQFSFIKSNNENYAVSNLYNAMLQDVMTADLSSYTFKYDYEVITNDKLQNLIVASEKVSGTPEPATLVLLGSALGMGAFVRRRRNA